MGSEVEAGDVTLARVFVHGMHVALAKEHIHFRVEFNLGTVGGIKKHTVPPRALGARCYRQRQRLPTRAESKRLLSPE